MVNQQQVCRQMESLSKSHIPDTINTCLSRLVFEAWAGGTNGKYLESVTLEKRILEEDPGASFAWSMIGNAYQSMSDTEEFSRRSKQYRQLAQEAWGKARSFNQNADMILSLPTCLKRQLRWMQ